MIRSTHEMNDERYRAHMERKKVEDHNTKMEGLDNLYKEQIKEVKEQAQDRLLTQKAKNNHLLMEEAEKHQERLKKVSENIEKTKTQLESEKNLLTGRHQEQMLQLQDNMADQIDYTQETFQDNVNLLNNYSNEQIQKLSKKNIKNVYDLKKNQNNEFMSLQNNHDSKYEDRKRYFEKVQNQNELRFLQAINTMKTEQGKALAQEKNEHLYKILKIKEEQNNELDSVKKQHLNKMKDSQQDFYKKFLNLKNEHQEILKHLENRSTELIRNLKINLAAKKDELSIKGENPFYNLHLLETSLTDEKDHYVLKVKVPEEESNFVKITGHKNTAKITQTRDYQDEVIGKDGSLNKSKKYENFFKSLNLEKAVDFNKVYQYYDNTDSSLTFILPRI